MKQIMYKLVSFVLTLFFVAFLTFLLFQIIPGDAAITKLGTDATPEQIMELREKYGYDDGVLLRFGKWLGNAIRGDFGISLRYSPMSVGELIGGRLPATIGLAVYSIILIIIISLPLGMLTAAHPGSRLDRISDVAVELMMAVPSFVQGILLTYIFGIVLFVFVPGGYVPLNENPSEYFKYMLFPALSVAIPKIGMTVRFMKTAIKREYGKDYVRLARAKGNNTFRIMTRHIFKNSLLPVITFIGLIVAEVLAGSIMAEQVFALPGMGRLLVNSISNRDYNVVQAIVMYIALVVITINFMVDVIYRLIDPRIGKEEQQ